MNQKILQDSIAKVLRPLVRILIRHGVSHGDFNEVAKRIFVEIAEKDFRLEGRKQTNARIAMLTGVQRKEVSRLLALPPIELDELDVQYNRGVRVTGGWRRDPDFLDDAGQPGALPFDGENGFTELVRRYSGDLPARAVLDELVRVGNVRQDGKGMISLLSDAMHVPLEDKESQFNIMGNAGSDLFSTIDYNFECAPDDTRLQLTVAYDNLPANAVRRFQHISHEDCLQLLKKFDVWLAEHDRDTNAEPAETDDSIADDRFRAGIGIYYFEEEVQ